MIVRDSNIEVRLQHSHSAETDASLTRRVAGKNESDDSNESLLHSETVWLSPGGFNLLTAAEALLTNSKENGRESTIRSDI